MKSLNKIPYIQKLISEGEHTQQDFKYAINDSRKIAKSLSAFANTKGGRLLIGVRDNQTIAGVKTEEEYHMVEAAAQLYCKPEIQFETRKHNIQGKTVLEIQIHKATERPVLAQNHNHKWLAYIRVEDQNLLANGILLKIWKAKQIREKSNTGVKFEYTQTEKILLQYLTQNQQITFSKFRRIANIPFQQAEKTLINLILLNVIQINFTTKLIYYTLKE